MDTYDPWKAAEEATEPPRVYFGQIELDVWPCVLAKGIGKVPFDPQQHQVADRRTSIKVIASPLASSKVNFSTERDMLAESREWASIALKSLKALSISPAQLNKKWAQYRMVETGRTYVSNKDGSTKTATMFEFIAVYNTEAEAEAAAAALFGKHNGNGHAQEAEPDSNGNSEKDTAAKFLPTLVKLAGSDMAKLADLLAKNPTVSKHFDISSAEVVALISPF